MNSAPVQLLPIEGGNANAHKTPTKETSEVKGRSFKEVLESSIKSDSVKEAVDKKGKEPEKEKSGKLSKADKIEAAAKKLKEAVAEAAAETDPKETVRKSGEKKKDERFEKLKLVSGRKTPIDADKDPEKTAEAGLVAALIQPAVQKILIKIEPVEKDEPEGKNKRLASGLSTAVERLKQKNRIPAIARGTAVQNKPQIRFVAAASGEKKTDPAVKGKESKKTKLTVSDYRRNASVSADKGLKVSAVQDNLSQKTDSDPASRFQQLTSHGESLSELRKTESVRAEIKNMQSAVHSQLKDTINSQIVKQAGIVVKGNGTGEIRLVMKPESLGNVRIHLSLNDNHIAGRIIVENNIVREIFESNLENLYKAFGSEGFENGGLEVSVQGQGGNSDGRGRKNGHGITARAAKIIEDAVPEVVETEWRNNTVNMVV